MQIAIMKIFPDHKKKTDTKTPLMCAGETMSLQNVLLVGLVSHREDAKLSYTVKRDQSRILCMRKDFETVFTLVKQAVDPDPTHHVTSKMNRSGAHELVQLMNNREHTHKSCTTFSLSTFTCSTRITQIS